MEEKLSNTTCKNCKKEFKSLMQHLSKIRICGESYSEIQMASLKAEILATRKKYMSEYYEQTKDLEDKRKDLKKEQIIMKKTDQG